MLSEYLSLSLNESTIKAKKVPFGSNAADYDDEKVGYHAASRSYFAVTTLEEGYLLVSINRENGRVKFTLSDNTFVGRMVHVPATFRRQNVRMALNYMPIILFLLSVIITKFFNRIASVELHGTFNIENRMIQFLVRSPEFRTLLLRFRYRNRNIKEIEGKNGKIMVYQFNKMKK